MKPEKKTTKFYENKKHFFSSLLPASLFGILSGAGTGVVVMLYRFFAQRAVALSESFFHMVKTALWLIPLALVLLFLVATALARILKKEPDLGGGGIPTSIGNLRGLFSMKPTKNLIGVFLLSLVSFLFGVPLGTEGPSVQMGTAIGSLVVEKGGKRHRAWRRFAMTGGASAGFSVATGAPLAGILFGVEEAHRRISPLIVLTSVLSVLSANIAAHLLSPLLGVTPSLFALPSLPTLSLKEYSIPLAFGLLFGLVSVLFLKSYQGLSFLITEKIRSVPQRVKIFLILALTLLFGLFSPAFVSTGHHLILSLFESTPALWFLILIVILRSFLTLSANLAGITGGIFLPILAIGASFSAVVGRLFLFLGMDESLFSLLLALGICCAISGMMQMPMTAILFGVEALGLGENLLPLILAVTLAYLLPEAMGEEAITELVLERRIQRLSLKRQKEKGTLSMTVEENSFAHGKEVRDIFWPDGVQITSVDHTAKGRLLTPGDVLHIHYNTAFLEKTKEELSSILASQKD